MGEHWCKEPCTYGKRALCTEVLEKRTLHWGGDRGRKRKEGQRQKKKRLWQVEVVKVKQKDGRISEDVSLPLLLESVCSVNWKCVFYCYSSLRRWRGGVGGWGSFVKRRMKWTFDVRFAAGFKRDTQPAFSCRAPRVAPHNEHVHVKGCGSLYFPSWTPDWFNPLKEERR